ncbi:hypothetical protein ABL840_26860 [Variovorax sp. NFACC27]|uniref:hypothetical protein n=1 Tax=unclassified Variovorax TaxID=663243 RepID=UPI0008991E2F|nr:hypothetical protein SAMN03159371_03678 [Variovorax sp. NFACC28]SEG77985.1 hypothetical protein SAMN03159365_03757 [Variovorax sp. NFACC29]SFC96323.1 hypothetical protein SAMN03159379_03666 [Variovorax sp. NFACC26]SFG09368.1 hypothetical protein SAMN03159447_01774 [Variovorax sp. NFACC27]
MSQLQLDDVGADAPARGKVTTAMVNQHMAATFGEANGYACLFEVASGTGSNARTFADIVVMNLWPSRGMDLVGYEVKTSRSDWQREMKLPAKAWPVMQYMDRWFLLAAPGVAKLDEIPTNWGFIEFDGARLKYLKPAPKLEPIALSKTFLGALLRKPVRDVEGMVKRATEEALSKVDKTVEERIAKEMRRRGEKHQELVDKLAKLKDATGIDLLEWQPEESQVHAIKFALKADPMTSWRGLPAAVRNVEQALETLRELHGKVAE